MQERVELDLTARFRIGPHGGAVDAREVGGQVNRLAVLAFPYAHSPIPQRLASSSCERRRSRWSWVTEVTTSSSAPLKRCSADSRSATSSGSPTNWVSSRSLTTGSCCSDSGRISLGAGYGTAPTPVRMEYTHCPYPAASCRAVALSSATTTS